MTQRIENIIKTETAFDIILNQNCMPVGAPISQVSIEDYDINSLIKKLSEKSIPIDKGNSEKEITYKIFEEQKSVSVPFNASFDDSVRTRGYVLRTPDKVLVISLKRYNETNLERERLETPRNPHWVGGDAYSKDRIYCSLLFQGKNVEEGKIIEDAKDVIKSFYTKINLLDTKSL